MGQENQDMDIGKIKLYSEGGIKEKVSLLLASCLFTGFLPLAPGTWGSAFMALLTYFIIPTQGIFILIFLVLLFAVGVVTSNILEKYDGIRDNPKIVIDEALGFALSVAFLPKKWLVFVLAFIVFRILDIWKPYPIRYIDKKVKSGFGVMLDDIVAGVFTNLIIRIFTSFTI